MFLTVFLPLRAAWLTFLTLLLFHISLVFLTAFLPSLAAWLTLLTLLLFHSSLAFLTAFLYLLLDSLYLLYFFFLTTAETISHTSQTALSLWRSSTALLTFLSVFFCTYHRRSDITHITDRFEIMKQLDRGTFGAVFKALLACFACCFTYFTTRLQLIPVALTFRHVGPWRDLLTKETY